ncbi:Glycosyltransferase involved in cell wall bisynthesis [Eubacterium maltosivorans]|uniref:glycosyltransferase family 2 protein n=1 Tax=Eubacterium maltosivorans TaxID=2041044 RepID=UPI00088495B4|nr:glycosyltransferase family 2 protein [Eubacterium maltosivorans]WPK80049.1 hypothetical protein EUMA32_14590 [Eubacterium maltosivorans]SDP86463.1 Glycosyltransferase involved in cell wall bisynthesis [Eubacterium maltosivorans]
MNNTNYFNDNKFVKSFNCFENFPKLDNPFITIAIPTYKRGYLLKEAIISAINQEKVDFSYEIVVVDNEPSNNETLKLMKLFAEDPKVIYFKNEKNLGMFGNWNRCFELARGNWVALLHDDDLLYPNYLKRISYFINKKKKAKCICVERNSIGKNEPIQNWKAKLKKKFFKNHLYKINSIDNYILYGNVYAAPTCGTIFNKQAVLKSGGFNPDMGVSADWFMLILFNRTNEVYKTIEPLGCYRWQDNLSLDVRTLIKFVEEKEKFIKNSKDNNYFLDMWFTLFEESYKLLDIEQALNFCVSIQNEEKREIIKEHFSFNEDMYGIKCKLLEIIKKVYKIKYFINI